MNNTAAIAVLKLNPRARVWFRMRTPDGGSRRVPVRLDDDNDALVMGHPTDDRAGPIAAPESVCFETDGYHLTRRQRQHLLIHGSVRLHIERNLMLSADEGADDAARRFLAGAPMEHDAFGALRVVVIESAIASRYGAVVVIGLDDGGAHVPATTGVLIDANP